MQRQQFIKHRWVFNLIWWISMMVFGFVIFFSPLGEIIGKASISLFGHHWYAWFFGIFGPVLVIEAILHWYALNHLYPDLGRGNLVCVIFMPLFLIVSYSVVSLILFAIALSQLHN